LALCGENIKEIRGTLILGILLREVFSFWTGHPFDFELWVRMGYSIVHGQNPYLLSHVAPGLTFATDFGVGATPTIAYLPFWPLATAFIYVLYADLGIANRFFYYFMLKQPIIFGDVWLGYLIFSFVRAHNPRVSKWAARFWLLNPYAIILSGIWGMFDSLAMGFVLVAIRARKETGRTLNSAMAIFVKSIPVIYTVPLVLKTRRGWWALILAVMIPGALTLLVLSVFNWSLSVAVQTLVSTMPKGGETMSAWDSLFFLSANNLLPNWVYPYLSLLGSIWIPAVAISIILAYKRFGVSSTGAVIQSLLLITCVFLIFKAQVNEQYAVYILALGVLDVAVWHPQRKRLLSLMLISALAFLVVNNLLLIRFLQPIYSQATTLEANLIARAFWVRFDTKLLLGVMFTVSVALYLASLLRGRNQAEFEERIKSTIH
jgi:hypothetical protein